MAIQHRKTTNIYLTYKVFQLIEQLRRRLRPRIVLDSPKRTFLGSNTCLGLERKAVLCIEKSVSRVSGCRAEKKRLQRSASGVHKRRKNDKPSLKLQTPGSDVFANRNTSGEDVQQYVDENTPRFPFGFKKFGILRLD